MVPEMASGNRIGPAIKVTCNPERKAREMSSSKFFKRLSGAIAAAIGVLVLSLFAGTLAQAQFETASVLGFVHDTTGAAIPGASVTLTNIATGVEVKATANAQGEYEFTSVHIGDYKISGSASGFSDTVTETFTVQVNARQRVDV